MPNEIPESLRRELHLRCDREITARILRMVRSNPAVCIKEVAKAVGCSDITARKNLDILVRVGLAVEKKIGKARVFVRTNELREVPKYDLP
jgi:DeoR/GlpR family transcriptional regulator of sugar metabolism